MNKNMPVAELELDDDTATIIKVDKSYELDYLPVGIEVRNGIPNKKDLNEWWFGRSIPASRSGIRTALEKLNIQHSEQLMIKCYGLSLSDQYWIAPEDMNLNWHDVNFFENDFSEDIGNILIGLTSDSDKINYMSPDSASDGWLKKKWRIVDGERVLFKAGSGSNLQEPYNEVLATAIMKRLGIPCVEYSLTLIGDKPYSACKDFITESTELVTAHNIIKSVKKRNDVSLYEHYINCCKEYGITDIEHSMNQMLTLDYIIVNEDRHLNNFGLIRNADTLEYVSAAPVYDSGTSMWFNTAAKNIKAGARDIESKPFKTRHADQIKLVTDFDWLDLDKLYGIEDEFAQILSTSEPMDDERKDVLCDALKTRIELLKDAMNHSVKYTNIQSIGEEPEKDIAYSGEDNGIVMQ